MEEWAFKHVRYFTLRWEGEDLSMFHEFMQRMAENETAVDQLDSILYWAQHIGEKVPYPLRDKWFRFENAAKALPPPAGKVKQALEDAANKDDNNIHHMEAGLMRLYCHPINDHVVFLFSGDIKTEGVGPVQECKVVKPYFQQANRLAKKIDEAIRNDEIRFIDNGRDIEWDKDFELEL